MTNAELVAEFTTAAQSLGKAIMEFDPGISAARRLVAVDAELRTRGTAARLSLLSLLDQKDRVVRYYAAQHLLGIVPERARKAIEDTANCWFDSIAADARITLRRLASGEYEPD